MMRSRAAFLITFLLLFAYGGAAQDPPGGSLPQTSPPAPPAVPARIRLSSTAEQAQLIQQVAPVYPAIAKTAHVQGTVVLHAIIGKDGSVKTLEYVSGPALLMKSAIDAVMQWKYKPLLLNGQPLEVDTTVNVVYQLDGPGAAAAASTASAPTGATDSAALKLPTPADLAKQPYVYESVHGSIRYEDDGTGSVETQARIRVQSFAGVQQLGQLIFDYSAENERLEIRSVRVTQPDGKVVTAGTEAVQDLTAPVAQLAPVYTDARQKHVTVPGLTAGSILEYDTVRTTFKPLTPGQFWDAWNFVIDSVCLDEELDLDVPNSRWVNIAAPKDLAQTINLKDGRRIYHWKTSNSTPAVANAAAMFSGGGFDPAKLLEGIQKQPPRQVMFSTFRSWDDVGKWSAGLEQDRRVASPDVRAKANEVVKDATTDAEKAQAIYEYVSRNIRYVSLSFGVGRFQPHAAADVLANQYGDCKDKATLLGAMLAAEGIQSSIALINSGQDLDAAVATPQQFDHAIVVASVAGKDVWLDSTLGVGPYAYLLPQLRGKSALVVGADGSGMIRKTPAVLTSPQLYRAGIEGSLQNGKADLKFSFDVQGGDLEVLLRAGFLQASPGTLTQAMMQGVKAAGDNDASISDVSTSDPSDTQIPLHLEATFTGAVKHPGNSSDKSNEQALPLTGQDLAQVSDLLGYVFPAMPKGDSANAALQLGGVKNIYLHVKYAGDMHQKPFTVQPVQLGGEFAIYEMSSSWDGTTFDLNLHLGVLKNEVPADRLVDYAKFRQELLDSLAAAAAKMGGGNTTPTPAAAATDSAAPELRRRDSMTPVPSTSGPVIFRIGEAVEAASLIKVVDPKYPKAAKDAHITGTLLFDAIIGGDGAVSQLDFVSGPAELKDAAEDAIHQWRYKPFMFNGRPASVRTEIRIVYGKHGAEKYPPHY